MPDTIMDLFSEKEIEIQERRIILTHLTGVRMTSGMKLMLRRFVRVCKRSYRKFQSSLPGWEGVSYCRISLSQAAVEDEAPTS